MGRLLIVAIAAFRVVTAVDVAALVSNMALAEKESLLSVELGGVQMTMIPRLDGMLVIRPPFLDSTFLRSSCRTRGRAFGRRTVASWEK